MPYQRLRTCQSGTLGVFAHISTKKPLKLLFTHSSHQRLILVMRFCLASPNHKSSGCNGYKTSLPESQPTPIHYSSVEGAALATGGVQSSIQGCSVCLQSPEWHRTCIYRCDGESVYAVKEISVLVIEEADSPESTEDTMG